MRAFSPILLLAVVLSPVVEAAAQVPIYRNDFEAAEVGKEPAEMLITAGAFAVQQGDGGRVLELPGDPLDTFGLLFGPTQKGEVSAGGRFFATKKGRKFPTYGVSLGGVAGYRLEMSGAKKALEIFKGDEVRQSVPFEWVDGAWVSMRIQVRKVGDGWVVEGKAWPAGGAEPAAWTIRHEVKEEPAGGRAGIWGAPYAGTPIRFDDLIIEAAR